MASAMSSAPPPLPPKTRLRSSTSSLLATATVISAASNERICIAEEHCTTTTNTFLQHQSSSASPHSEKHVVKIRINPDEDVITPAYNIDNSYETKSQFYPTNNSCIRININNNEESMIRADNFIKASQERPNPYFFYPCPGNISSGQSSPSDTLDSGTCSDLDGSTPPPPTKKKPSTTVTVTVNGNHKRNCSLTSSGIDVDSDEEGSNISCDSLNSHELNNVIRLDESEILDSLSPVVCVEQRSGNSEAASPSDVQEEVITPVVITPGPPPPPSPQKSYRSRSPPGGSIETSLLPDVLLEDIRGRNMTIIPSTTMIIKKIQHSSNKSDSQFVVTNGHHSPADGPTSPVFKDETNRRLASPVPKCENGFKSSLVQERTYEDRKLENAEKERKDESQKRHSVTYDADRFYKFHLNENFDPALAALTQPNLETEETFAGYKDYLENNRSTSSTIRSSKGTVRGVKNRVRAGIATFLQVHSDKNYKEKEIGKVIVYTTTMGVVRSTFHDCLKVKQILRTLMVKYEERDVMSREVQAEIRDRLNTEAVSVPQLFVEGQHIGDAETVERLNENGELRQILKPFKSADACLLCGVCGGYRLLPCSMCNGSKKSLRRNEFTAEFVALKCMNCDEVGLVKCTAC